MAIQKAEAFCIAIFKFLFLEGKIKEQFETNVTLWK